MDRTEYLAEYCASIDCKSKKLEDCDVCMYNKGISDTIDLIDRPLWNNSHEVWKAILEKLKEGK